MTALIPFPGLWSTSLKIVAKKVNDLPDPVPEVTIKPLPEENKPLGFNGAVGNFSVEASLNHKSIAADDEGDPAG